VTGTTVYAGGRFQNIDGQPRSCLAAVDATSGGATSWDPNADAEVHALALNGSKLYAGGMFTSIGGAARRFAASLDVATGSATLWDPGPNNPVLAIVATGPDVYMGGSFNTLETTPQSYLAAFAEIPTAITLSTLSAVAEAGRVRIRWHVSDSRTVPLGVYRRTPDSDWALLSRPTVEADRTIVLVDETVSPGLTYGYRLVVRDVDAKESAIETWVAVPAAEGAPSALRLGPMSPNPVGERGRLSYGLPRPGRVRLAIFDAQGRRVVTIVERMETAGWHSAVWDGRDERSRAVSSGIYFAHLEMPGAVQVRKIVLAR